MPPRLVTRRRTIERNSGSVNERSVVIRHQYGLCAIGLDRDQFVNRHALPILGYQIREIVWSAHDEPALFGFARDTDACDKVDHEARGSGSFKNGFSSMARSRTGCSV